MGINYVLNCVRFLVILFPSYHLVTAHNVSHPVANLSSLLIDNPSSDHFIYSLFGPSSYANAQDVYHPVANLSSLWINNPSPYRYVYSDDKSMLMPILLRTSTRPVGFVCGFYCNYECDGYLFAVLIFPYRSDAQAIYPAREFTKVVWSANRNNLVGSNATLQLTEEGDLILREANGTVVWSTNTSGKSVVGLRLTKTGNLILFDSNNASVWQSFDHPTDSLIPGQTLVSGQKMIASVSDKNWSEGSISFYATDEGIAASVGTTPPLRYFSQPLGNTGSINKRPNNVSFSKRGLFLSSDEPIWEFPTASFARYTKLEPTGQLICYEWIKNKWRVLISPMLMELDCLYPMACGKYGICSNGECSCPKPADGETSYFRQISYAEPHLGCSEITPLSCEASHYHSLLELKKILYFPFPPELDAATDIESCKRSCLENCSCKAAVFVIFGDTGLCYLRSEIFSLQNVEVFFPLLNWTTFLKVQNVSNIEPPPAGLGHIPGPRPPPKKTISETSVILLSSLGAFLCLFLTVIVFYSLFLDFKEATEDEEDYLYQVPGMPSRFSHEILVVATEYLSQKLGKGGFGSVFKGIMSDGTKVAVKCLDVFCQTKKSFLAPEWFSSAITEKVDVYSFGVVILEILCGRKNLDRSLPEGDMLLLCLFKQKAEEDQLLDLVDKNSEDMQVHGAEVVEMMRLAAWCLQSEVNKRPSMSVVVKVLEGVVNVEDNLEYNFFYPAVPIGTQAVGRRENNVIIGSPLLPSVLSGPR